MKRHYSRCRECSKGRSRPKRRPYGSKPGLLFCRTCDHRLTYDVSKSSVRMKVRLKVNQYLKRLAARNLNDNDSLKESLK